MKKRIVLIALFMFMIPFMTIHANETEIDWTKSIINNGNNVESITRFGNVIEGDYEVIFQDNDLTFEFSRPGSGYSGAPWIIHFTEPISPDTFAVYFDSGNITNRMKFDLVYEDDSKHVILETVPDSFPSEYIRSLPETDKLVKELHIIFQNAGTYYLRNVALFDGDYTKEPAEPPITPVNFEATASDSSVYLAWDSVDRADSYNVYRDGVLIASPTTNSYIDTDVTNGETYSYNVSAVNEYGESAKSNTVTVTIDTSPPAAPTDLTAKPGSERITLNWTASTDPYLAGYNVYVDGVKANSELITSTSYTVTGLSDEVTYTFYVTAVRLNNLESAHSNTVQATPLPSGSVDLDGIDRVASALGVIGTAVSFIRTVVPDWLLVGLGIIFAYIIIRILYWIVQKIRTEAFNRKNLNKESIVKAAKEGTLTKWTGKRDADGNRIREKVSEKEAAKLIKKYDRKDRIDRMSTKEFDERIGREERQKMYDYLTAKGRISERDAWVRNTGTWGIKQRDGRSGRSVRPGRDSSR